MIYFDVTKAAAAKHRSGLTRVSAKLVQALGGETTACRWVSRDGRGFFVGEASGRPVAWTRADWLLTAELFSEQERPGWWAFIRERRCRLAAIFHDAIPLKLPHVTWPQSVSRHPEYMKMLAEFDRVFAVSEASRRELTEFWRWQGVEPRGAVETIVLGADFAEVERVGVGTVSDEATGSVPRLLCVGILEPRKNQVFLLDVCDALWGEGLRFELHVVGRVNPHFGKPVVAKIRALAKRWKGLMRYHEAATDAAVLELYRSARATVSPTIAEGCGLPLLESLWLGVPCVCSDLPVLRENADGGGCVAVAVNDAEAWKAALRRVLTDDTWRRSLSEAARARELPTWAGAAKRLVAGLGGG